MTIDTLLNELLRHRPHGWSVTRRGEFLSVRPVDRGLCKFSITLEHDGRLRVARFDRVLNHWTSSQYLEPGSLNAQALYEQMQRRCDGSLDAAEDWDDIIGSL